MLAVQPFMDILPKSTYADSSHSIMRQPSAEDLDAAHQLVSSARGERNGTYVPFSIREQSPATQQATAPAAGTDDGRDDRAGQVPESANVTGLEQICRYIPPFPLCGRFNCFNISPNLYIKCPLAYRLDT